DNTPVGDLPSDEQGSYALIVARDAGALLKMPVTPSEANMLTRNADVVINTDGGITATLREQAVGQSAVRARTEFRGLPRPEYEKQVESWITRGATGAKVSKIEPSDDRGAGKFSLEVEFAAERYAQLMQGRLLVFKPAIVSRRESLALTGAGRKQPIVLRAHAYDETIRFKLPSGFELDELPDAVKLEASFGTYQATYEMKEGQLYFKRRLSVVGATIPPSEYPKVRSFFEKIGAAEQAPVVLARK